MNNPKMDAMLSLAIAMSTGSASEALEAVQNAEQNRARHACKLPKIMYPNIQAFLALGFKFEDIGDDVLYQATLPDGWTLSSDGNILDSKDRIRGSYYYTGSFYDRGGKMSLNRRFDTTYVINDDEEMPITVVAVDRGEIIYTAGKCKNSCCMDHDNLRCKAMEYLNIKFPDWRDPTKYWD